MRKMVLYWMQDRHWHLKYPRIFTFWEWVIMPRSWGGHLGFRNWLRYIQR